MESFWQHSLSSLPGSFIMHIVLSLHVAQDFSSSLGEKLGSPGKYADSGEGTDKETNWLDVLQGLIIYALKIVKINSEIVNGFNVIVFTHKSTILTDINM